MAIKLAVIDGTGPEHGYFAAMTGSFCNALKSAVPHGDYDYQRGPTTWGKEVLYEATWAANWLRKQSAAAPNSKLMLAGYSRGGSAAIMAAEMLRVLGVGIDGLFLFDPVARHAFPGGEVIPDNVAYSRTAIRSQALWLVMKYEGTIVDDPRLGATSNPCRPSFGNTGLSWRGFGDHKVAPPFIGTHGALGGVGWGFVSEDKACMAKVSQWMGGEMKARGLEANLGDGRLDTVTKRVEAGFKTKLAGQALDAAMIGKNAIERARGGWAGF